PSLQRLLQAGDELGAVEVLAAPAALDDRQACRLDALVGGEARRARGAFAPASDGDRVVQVARVDDASVALAAVGATHRLMGSSNRAVSARGGVDAPMLPHMMYRARRGSQVAPGY